jgi:hypothetical protein
MLGILRGLAANPDVGRPEEFAETLLRIIGAQTPTPVRIPIGPGAYEMLSEAVRAAEAELESARALAI